MKFHWVEILLVVVIAVLIAQYPIRIIYRGEIRGFEEYLAGVFGMSHESLGFLGAGAALVFIGWRELAKKKRAERDESQIRWRAKR